MSTPPSWQRWLRQPQSVRLRRALFQVHLWSGLGIGLYVIVISISGSILVYRSELRQTFEPQPRLVEMQPRLVEIMWWNRVVRPRMAPDAPGRAATVPATAGK